MKRLSILAAGLSILAMGCGSTSSPTTSSSNPTTVKFAAALLPANETPAMPNASEANGSGTATITFNLTRDASGTITAATADFAVSLAGYPPNTPVNAAHIHNGPAGVAAGVFVSLGLTPGANILANGSGSFSVTGITNNMSPANAQDMINNPSQYYFNVHSTLNPGGFSRGQLVKQ
jgi:ABC-type Fe3+-hydroxamate transport system substrate-binding protein